jgi:DNA-binding NarL/FixJ family response regulator
MTTPAVARVLVADDHAVVRHGLRLLLDREPDLTVVAEAADGAQAVDHAVAGGVDLAILDIAMPRMTGLQAARELSRRRPHPPMLMLSMYDNDQFLFEALKAGASGYVLKSGADRDIVTAGRAALAGQRRPQPLHIDPPLIQRVVHRAVPAPVFRRQCQPHQRLHRPVGAQHGIGQLEQRVRAEGQTPMQLTPEPCQLPGSVHRKPVMHTIQRDSPWY